jgi:hypothetical protein
MNYNIESVEKMKMWAHNSSNYKEIQTDNLKFELE